MIVVACRNLLYCMSKCVVKMTCGLPVKSFGSSCVVHVILISYLVHSLVVAAPPPSSPPVLQQSPNQSIATASELTLLDGKSSSGSQKTADLVPLISETLKINNKTTTTTTTTKSSNDGAVGSLDGGKQAPTSFRDDWTFDRVEYDLMEFLQELNARYQHNGTNQAPPEFAASLEERRDQVVASDGAQQQPSVAQIESTVTKKTVVADCARVRAPSTGASGEVVTTSSIEQVKKELDLVAPKATTEPPPPVDVKSSDQSNEPKKVSPAPEPAPRSTDKPGAAAATLPASSEPLPISLASGDHDISESTWQYGIFDRFTRPRASTTSTPSPADVLAASATNPNLAVRSFNSDECGLRNYRVDTDPDYFPSLGGGGGGVLSAAGSQLDTDEISKELSQRRQRPPLGSSFFASHKKYHLSSSSSGDGVARDELGQDRDKNGPDAPPYDRYGEPANSVAGQQANSKYPTEKLGSASSLLEGDSPPGDSEFNLALRRQWMQQQLGSTLQILGYNSTSDNQSYSSGSGRENMMKMSAGKLAKSYAPVDHKLQPPPPPLGVGVGVGQSLDAAQLNERELKARQDELKLEARVIGGNDARLGDSPWSASLQALVSRPGTGGVEYRHYCGGTIISEHYILTAAHCLDFMVGRESRLFVVIGDLNWRMSTASLHGRRFGIEKLLIHGGYKSTAFGHDIGLIKTKESMRPLKVNGRYIINSVCLPERNVEHTGEAELVGWGLFSNRNEMADALQIADVPILPRPLCVDLYRRRTGLIQWLIGIELITEKQICAGTFGRGICQGDSGSALVYNEKTPAVQEAPADALLLSASSSPSEVLPDGKADIRRILRGPVMRDQQQRATIIGTVAFGGIRRCSYQSLPGVYMQTSKYLDWILPRIQP